MYNKADWIKAHGEDGWEEEKKRRSLFYRERYKRKAEQIKERERKYYAKNKDIIRSKFKEQYWSDEDFRKKCNEASKKYKRENKEHFKAYREVNKEHISDYCKQYRKEHIENFREYDKKRVSTEKGRAKNILGIYRKSDNTNNRGECTISRDWIVENIFTSKCIYCGDSNWRHLGCDRIDNDKPHTPENVVCACGICNCERQCRKMSVEEFVEYRKTHPRDEEQPLELIDEVLKPDGTIIKVIKKNPLLSA